MRTLCISCLLLGACAPAPAAPEAVSAAAALTTASVRAVLDFQPGWVQVQRGAIVRGGHVDVTYAASRLSACAAPTVFSFARFEPGGQLFSSDEALGFDVPSDATGVALWFHAVAPGCEQWDSDYGRNWSFPVVAAAPSPIGWVGDWGSSTNRDCLHKAGVPEPLTIDEYMRERACIYVDADVWVAGTTDGAEVHPEWIAAQVQWSKDAGAPVDSWLDYQGIIGHNARFRWSIPYEIRNVADWSAITYAFRFSTDGTTWKYAEQPTGDDWTIARAFMLPSP
jgi:hypothetical protein